MQFSFDITSDKDNLYRVILSSGEDAFFVNKDLIKSLGNEVEIVEIDLERIKGTSYTSSYTLSKIAEGIGKCFRQNNKAILYYYCDDMNEIPLKNKNKATMHPQEYRSTLFSKMFERYMSQRDDEDIIDYSIMINEESNPLFMHLIARKQHIKYINFLRDYIVKNYGK